MTATKAGKFQGSIVESHPASFLARPPHYLGRGQRQPAFAGADIAGDRLAVDRCEIGMLAAHFTGRAWVMVAVQRWVRHYPTSR